MDVGVLSRVCLGGLPMLSMASFTAFIVERSGHRRGGRRTSSVICPVSGRPAGVLCRRSAGVAAAAAKQSALAMLRSLTPEGHHHAENERRPEHTLGSI